jgi:hypothetical protein
MQRSVSRFRAKRLAAFIVGYFSFTLTIKHDGRSRASLPIPQSFSFSSLQIPPMRSRFVVTPVVMSKGGVSEKLFDHGDTGEPVEQLIDKEDRQQKVDVVNNGSRPVVGDPVYAGDESGEPACFEFMGMGVLYLISTQYGAVPQAALPCHGCITRQSVV